jgi:hypothetical protein
MGMYDDYMETQEDKRRRRDNRRKKDKVEAGCLGCIPMLILILIPIPMTVAIFSMSFMS